MKIGNRVQFVIYDGEDQKVVSGDSVFVVMDDGSKVELTLGCSECSPEGADKTPLSAPSTSY